MWHFDLKNCEKHQLIYILKDDADWSSGRYFVVETTDKKKKQGDHDDAREIAVVWCSNAKKN